jgi:hypothetical protein
MSFAELAGTPLPAAPRDGSLPVGFPMLPFTGIADTALAQYQELEFQAVSPTRRKAIGGVSATLRAPAAAALAAGPSTDPPAGVTPQGLLADLNGGVIVNLTLMSSGGGTNVMRIQGISSALADALQSSQLFLVASDPTTLQTPRQPAPNGTVTIPATADGSEQWTIEGYPAPADWSKNGTLLVLKFAGKPLADLAADTGTWVQAADFNPGQGGVASAQQILEESIAQAQQRAKIDSEFQPFAQLVSDPSWQGVLLLNCPISPSQLPAQLAGLAAGIEASDFRAHHVGLTVTPLKPGGGLKQRDSSLYGLIFYESTSTAAGAQGPYAFNVLNLKVRFANSAVATFSSQIQLLVDRLFDEPSTLIDAATWKARESNVLLLDGVYLQQGASSGYAFSTPTDNFFSMTSGVLDSVDVASAQFVTVNAYSPGPPVTPGESRFALSGSLRFKPPPKAGGFDLFSFGPEADANTPVSPQRLFFSNLAVNVQYVPGEPAADAYTFDATKLTLDTAQSKPRDASVFNGFPLALSGFVHVMRPAANGGAAAATPPSVGFLGVDTPSLPQGSIQAPWFGVVADLGLGTPGALAAEAGFKASLLAGWSPGTVDSPNVAVGLKLPGTGGGGKLLSLESVLKLKIGDLTFDEDGGVYVLALKQIALSVLSLTFPPGGQIAALLFADPTGEDHTTLGWYAGYAKDGGGK